MNTRLAALLTLLSTAAFAQNISGTMTAAWDGNGAAAAPTTHVELRLQCGLTCPPAAPTTSYGVGGLVHAYYEAAPTEEPGSVSFGFATGVMSTGVSTMDSTNFPWGSNFHLVAKSSSCVCGNGALQSGFIDVLSNPVAIAPKINPPVGVPYQLGRNPKPSVIIAASPRGGETVTVTATGAGVTFNQTLTVAQWRGTSTSAGADSKSFELVPTMPGTVTVTAQVTGTPVATLTFDVVSGAAGGGGGGGSTGGGSGSNAGGGAPAGGCSAAGLSPVVALVLAALRRRRQLSCPTA